MATKKKVLKKMRAIAAEMPQLDVLKTKLLQRIKGAELIKNGITALSNGETVDPKQTYQRLKPVSGQKAWCIRCQWLHIRRCQLCKIKI